MGKLENDHQRKIKNGHFIQAFEFLGNVLKIGQGRMAEMIGCRSSYITNFKKGLRPVPDDVLSALVEASKSVEGCEIYKEYLLGNSDIMLLANVTDEERLEVERKKNNPDYELLRNKECTTESSEISKTDELARSLSHCLSLLHAELAEVISVKHDLMQVRRDLVSALQDVRREISSVDDYPRIAADG